MNIFEILNYLFILTIVFWTFYLFIGPYTQILIKKYQYGSQLEANYFPLLSVFKYIISSTKKYNHPFKFINHKLSKNPDIKALYFTGLFNTCTWWFVDTQLQKQVLQEHKYYKKADLIMFNQPALVKGGIFFSEYNLWKKQRASISEAFHFKNLKSFTPEINKIVDEEILSVKDNEMHKIVSTCSMIAGRVISSTFFGENFHKHTIDGKSIIQQLQDSTQDLSDYKRNIIHILKYIVKKDYGQYDFLCNNKERELLRNAGNVRQFLEKYVEKVIKSYENIEIEKPNNFFEILLKELKLGQTNQTEILDNFMSLFFAGIDTTGNFTGMCFYALAKEQQIQERLYNSIYNYFEENYKEKFTQNPYEFEIPHDDLVKIQDLNNFIDEAFRFYNPAPGLLLREVIQDHKVGDFQLRKGDQLSIVTSVNMQRDKYFEEPEKFDIDRWNTKQKYQEDSFSYIPFSAGPRNCIGKYLSKIEMKVMLIKFLLKYQVFRNPDKDLKIGVKLIATPVEEDLVYFVSRPKKV